MYSMYWYQGAMSIHTPYGLTAMNNVTKSTGIHAFHITTTCSWSNMPLTMHIYVQLPFYCSIHIKPTILFTSIKINKLEHLFTILLQNMGKQQICSSNAIYICHMPKLLKRHQWGKHANINATYELTGINYVTRSVVRIQGHRQQHNPIILTELSIGQISPKKIRILPTVWWVTECDQPLKPKVSFARLISLHPSIYASWKKNKQPVIFIN